MSGRRIGLFFIFLALLVLLCEQMYGADCASIKNGAPEALVRFLQADAHTANPQCVEEAIRRLGELKDKAATDVLITLLDFRRPETDLEKIIATSRTMEPFPAVSALFSIGKSTVQPLIAALKKDEMTEVARENAIDTLMAIYRDDPTEGIKSLKQAAAMAEHQEEAIRMEKYAQNAIKYCGKRWRDRCTAALQQPTATPDK